MGTGKEGKMNWMNFKEVQAYYEAREAADLAAGIQLEPLEPEDNRYEWDSEEAGERERNEREFQEYWDAIEKYGTWFYMSRNLVELEDGVNPF